MNTTWNIRIDVSLEYTERIDLDLRARLADYEAVIAAAYVAGKPAPDRTSIQLTLSAPTITDAQAAATSAVTTALAEVGQPAELVRMDTMPDEDFTTEIDDTALSLAGTREISEMLNVGKARTAQLIERPDFPRPLAYLSAGRIWNLNEVRAWAETWDRRPGRPRARFRGPRVGEDESS
ncbi:hypothetical protein ABZ801_00935 [Actinomadura sp. NPDC047616]|uniref:hypothetical protein n=1 Tax=Actinomadura sp. NPDC047616 TaxID=3155914 RepID=UPI0033DE3B55